MKLSNRDLRVLHALLDLLGTMLTSPALSHEGSNPEAWDAMLADLRDVHDKIEGGLREGEGKPRGFLPTGPLRA